MGIEIERKFLIRGDAWREAADEGTSIRQFYLAIRDGLSVRVRLREGRPAMLTVKTGDRLGARGEYEYAIPDIDARELEAAHVGTVIEKRRHLVPLGALTVEIDVFGGTLAPLILAEIELPAPDHPVALPDWIGRDVTQDVRYANASLAIRGRPS